MYVLFVLFVDEFIYINGVRILLLKIVSLFVDGFILYDGDCTIINVVVGVETIW